MKSKKEGIYKIKCKVNNKIYIGRSIDIEQRLKTHQSNLIKGRHINKKLQSDFNKYGEDNFIFDVERYTDNPLDTYYYESYYAEKYNSFEEGYNIGKLSKSESIRKIIDNLDYYTEKFDKIIEKIPLDSDYNIVIVVDEKVNKFFELDNYEIGVLVSIINSYIGWREGLSVSKDINMKELYLSQIDVKKLNREVYFDYI